MKLLRSCWEMVLLAGVLLFTIIGLKWYENVYEPPLPKHPTLPIRAYPALCNWTVYFETGKHPMLVAALDEFSALSGLPWVETTEEWQATLVLRTAYMYDENTLGLAHRVESLQYEVHVSINEALLDDPVRGQRVTLHELIHAFGMFHSDDEKSLMHEVYGPDRHLTQDDLHKLGLLAGTCGGQDGMLP